MSPESVRFAVLGPVRVRRGDTELEPGAPQERAFLALLLVRAGQPVSMDEIVDTLWGTDPPRSAVNVVRRHVGSLRRLLEPGLPARAEGRLLLRDAGGYRLLTEGDSPGEWRGPVAMGIAAAARASTSGSRPPAANSWRRPAWRPTPPCSAAGPHRSCPRCAGPPPLDPLDEDPLDEPLHARLILAAAQRPWAAAAFEETATAAGWRTKSAWALIAGADNAINPEVERFGAKRAGATIVEIEGASHAVAVSRPKEVAGLIRTAVRATG
ncbi:helix-turn-helix domain-containing protein [Streptomyces sp. ID05-39B]|uniref:AfsR/SARP family transcriptional regulator n=1 Tax=Streptomyces sp. ID05-39B TaxID=3028664 RepID=UPI0029A18A9E|nr:helix-turn-helix domain-containing protein [Streptomyces sp. ID05-39B]MDX3525625.1 helix-turn-helix domain-containing protein [Streptomyces sp. ID05-39B]